MATGRPAVLLCTSGTAAAHFHAAVIEAHQAEVPLLVCTADRPPELRDVAAPQTIDQSHLYGRRCGGSPTRACPTTPCAPRGGRWRRGPCSTPPARPPGPVHLNLPFRDPLVGEPGPLPPARAGGAPWHGRGGRAARC